MRSTERLAQLPTSDSRGKGPPPVTSHRRRRRRCLLPCLLLLALAAPLAAQPPKLGVSPPKFDVAITEPPTTHSFRVFNYDDEPLEVQVSAHNFDLDEENATRVLPPTEQSLDQWLVINPVRFTIPANGSQVVRFSIRPRLQPTPGEHRAMLFLTPQLLPEKQLSVRFNVRLGMAIYGQAGEVRRRGILHGVEVDAAAARFDVSSEGSAHVRFAAQYAIWPAAAFPGVAATAVDPELSKPGARGALPEPLVAAGQIPDKPVLPGTRRWIAVPFTAPLPPGEYVLDLNGHLGETVVDTAVHFTVPVAARSR